MSLMELLEDVADGNFEHAFGRLKDWWNGAPEWLKTFVDVAGDKIDAALTIAAEAGYAAAEASDKKGLDKLALATETAVNYLGDNAENYARGWIVTAIQAIWANNNK